MTKRFSFMWAESYPHDAAYCHDGTLFGIRMSHILLKGVRDHAFSSVRVTR